MCRRVKGGIACLRDLDHCHAELFNSVFDACAAHALCFRVFGPIGGLLACLVHALWALQRECKDAFLWTACISLVSHNL